MIRDRGSITWFATACDAPDRPASVPVRVIVPAGEPIGWLVWAHGGSWHAGSAHAWHHACAELAVAAGTAVVSVDYRLAPRHRHPAALLDVLAALAWARRCAAADGTGVAVGGDSAGATIAACAALVLRDRDEALTAQLLAYPPIDPSCRAASFHRDPGAFPQPAALAEAWRSYRGTTPAAPGLYSTPAEAADVRGVAPAVIAVGALDPVLDDVRGYRARLDRAGVALRYLQLPGVAHGAFLSPGAGLRNLRYCFGHFLNPAAAGQALRSYRAAASTPHTTLAVRVFVARTSAEAEEQAADYLVWRSRKDLGADEPLPSPGYADRHPWTAAERRRTIANREAVVVGDAATVRDQLLDLAAHHVVPELVVNTLAPRTSDRVRAYELLAGAFRLSRTPAGTR